MEIRLNDSNWLEGGYISATGRLQRNAPDVSKMIPMSDLILPDPINAKPGNPTASVEDRLELFLVLRAFQDQRKLRTGAAILFLAATALAVWSMKTWNDVRMDDARLRELAGGLLHNVYRARLTLRDIGGAWKLTGLDILEEERL